MQDLSACGGHIDRTPFKDYNMPKENYGTPVYLTKDEMHDDRLVLRNTGTLKLPLSKIIEGGSSKARNPRMQNMLRMIGYGENIGSGFPQILNAWKIAGWKEPVLEDKWDVQEMQLTMFVKNGDDHVNRCV